MKNSDKNIIGLACVLAALTIAVGAFGAHGIRGLVGDEDAAIFEIGVRYQMYHVFAIALIGLLPILSKKTKKLALILFLCGVLLFSGSLYLLALKSQLAFSVMFLGPVTPIGGFLLIFGWIVLAYGLLTKGRG